MNEKSNKKRWYWEEVSFIPDGVSAQDLLRFQGRIFVKSTVVEELKAKGFLVQVYSSSKYLSIGSAFGNRSNSQLSKLKLKLKALFFGILTFNVPQSLSAP